MSNILVSVVIPVYNSADVMDDRCMHVFDQTLEDIEFIFVDDCSEDGSYERLLSYKEKFKDKNIKVLRNEKNLGAGPTRNAGLSVATGKYVYFIDADDQMVATLLSEAVEKMEAEQSDLLFIAHSHETGDRVITHHLPLHAINTHSMESIRRHAAHLPHNPWTRVIRRELLTANNITFPDIRNGHSMCCSLHMLLCAERVSFLDEVLYRHIFTENSLSLRRRLNCIFEVYNYNCALIRKYGYYEKLHQSVFIELLKGYTHGLMKLGEQEKIDLTEKFFSSPDAMTNLNELMSSFTFWEKKPFYKLVQRATGKDFRRTIRERHILFLKCQIAWKYYHKLQKRQNQSAQPAMEQVQ